MKHIGNFIFKQSVLPVEPSPDADFVSFQLRDRLGSNYTVKPTDHLCSSCYKLHVSAMKALELQEQSTDSTLQNSMGIWEWKYKDVY